MLFTHKKYHPSVCYCKHYIPLFLLIFLRCPHLAEIWQRLTHTYFDILAWEIANSQTGQFNHSTTVWCTPTSKYSLSQIRKSDNSTNQPAFDTHLLWNFCLRKARIRKNSSIQPFNHLLTHTYIEIFSFLNFLKGQLMQVNHSTTIWRTATLKY